MKIINRKKFVRTIVVIIGIIFFINILIPDRSYSYKDIEYKTIVVLSGDTLWTIAKDEKVNNEYYFGKDVRDIVQDIKSMNSLANANLKINQTLKIPTY